MKAGQSTTEYVDNLSQTPQYRTYWKSVQLDNELLDEDEHGAANKHISRISRCKRVRTRFRLIGIEPKCRVNFKVLQLKFVLLIYNVTYTTF